LDSHYCLKYILDRFLVLLFVILLWPLMFLIWFAIHLEDLLCGNGFPSAFFTEVRVSAGKKFRIFKFRIFRPAFLNGEHEKRKDNEEFYVKRLEHEKGAVSSVGRILRDFYLDELPQIFNILAGQMTLVGPRPLPLNDPKRLEFFADKGLRSGLTGIHQINKGSKRTHFELDKEYYDESQKRGPIQLILYDFSILFRTLFKVGKGEGL